MSNILIPCPACGRELKIRDRKLLGKRGKCPSCQHAFVLEEPATMQFADSKLPVAAEPRWVPDGSTAAPPIISPTTTPVLPTADAPGIARLKGLRKKGGITRWIGVAAGVLAIATAGGIGYALWMSDSTSPSNSSIRAAANGTRNPHVDSQVDSQRAKLAMSPTDGQPISLAMIPAGARLLIHLRPADLWRPTGPGEEFRFCLGPLGEFLESQIKTLCKFPPETIEQVLFAWIPGPRGTAPDFAYVVRLKNDVKKSELLEAVGGELVDSYSQPVYIANDRAGVIADLKTFAMGPVSMAEEMASAVSGVNPMPSGVEGLVSMSDRTRHITVLFEPTAVLLDEEFLAPANARPFLRNAMDWFGEDAEAVLWSLHLESDRFYSDVHVRNQSGIRPAALEERLKERLDQLPKDLFTAMRSMTPSEMGKRQVIGRVPAMAKVFALATETNHGSRHVQLVTPLPDRAAPNLALGTLLAWDESTRTDFNKQPAPRPGSDSGATPTTIAERLKKKIDVDFRREPLQGAIDYIAGETKVTFDIDGDALKLSGYTKNMPQTFKLDQVPAATAILTIFQQKDQDKLCLVVDEQKKLALITTRPAAEQQGLKVYPLSP